MPTETKLRCCACCIDVCTCFGIDDCRCMDRRWQLVASGFANDVLMTCTVCADFNGTFDLDHSSACVWQTSTTGPCSANPRWKMSYNSGANRWEAVNAAGTLYTRAKADWNCTGSNVMTKVSDGGCVSVVNSPPSTVTLSPVPIPGCPCPDEIICSDCPPCEAVPRRWTFTLSGITNDPLGGSCDGPGDTCANYNQEYILEFCGAVGPGGSSLRSAWRSDQFFWFCDGLSNGFGADLACRGINGCSNDGDLSLRIGFGPDPNCWNQDNATTGGSYVNEAPWDCFGPNVMTLKSGVGACSAISRCSGWPATVTLEPA